MSAKRIAQIIIRLIVALPLIFVGVLFTAFLLGGIGTKGLLTLLLVAGLGFGITIHEKWKRWRPERKKQLNNQRIENQINRGPRPLTPSELNALYNAVSENFTSGTFVLFCDYLYQKPEQAISTIFSAFKPEQKITLLTGDEYYSPLRMLLDSGRKYKTLLKALFEGLSSKQRIEVLQTFFNKSTSNNPFCNPKMTKAELVILFENVTPEDRLKFLATPKGSGSNLLWMLEHCWDLHENQIPVMQRRLGRPGQRSRAHKIETTECQKQLEFLTVLFEGLSSQQLKSLLADRRILKPERSFFSELYPINTFDNTSEKKTKNPEPTLKPQKVPIINFLIEKGAIEASPDCDFAKLLQSPGINFTPYRNKLKPALAQTRVLPEVLEEIVYDYLVGESLTKKSPLL